MSKKFDYNYVKKYFEENGCELIEIEYKHISTPMKYKCVCGNISKIRFHDFKNGGRCKKCATEKQKHSFEQVKQFFKEKKCELLEKEYNNSRTKMEYRCRCGNISKITYHNFQQGRRCIKCSGKEKLTFEYVQQYFKDKGCELLEKDYKNCSFSMKYKCKCGNISKINFRNFKFGKRCKKCAIKSRSGENNYQWIKDRKSFEESNKIKKRCYRILSYSLKQTNQKKIARTQEMLGYTFNQLKDHIYSHFNWEKVKNEEWHIDHIFPIQAFMDFGIKDIKLINSLDNLQPLAKLDNLSKHDHYDKEEFKAWLKSKNYKYYE